MHRVRDSGYSLVEQLFVLAIIAILVGTAVPVTSEALDGIRTFDATRYLAGRITQARMDAIKRSTVVALKFEAAAPDYTYQPFVDGNRNGVRTADIRNGIDTPLLRPEHIGDNFANVRLELMADVPEADGGANTSTDGVRIGAARILATSPNGTATAGTIYVRGRSSQYAIRILGTTGRVRVLQYLRGERKWINRY